MRSRVVAAATAVLTLAATLVAPVIVGGPAASGRAAARAPVIVLDPGHSPSVYAVDKHGLVVSDYPNHPEMEDVFAVARIVAAKLRRDGYRVVFTKTRVYQRRTLAQRAAVANRVHAALALSIHDQAGRSGGIRYRGSNNIVYYQSVGSYRVTRGGHRVVFRNRHVALVSRRYARVFAAWRHRMQGATIRVQRNAGYDLGSRGLAAGNMWMVQLLSHVPWIYNEAGGNSAGRVGLSPRDRRNYANSLVRSVEGCVPPPSG